MRDVDDLSDRDTTLLFFLCFIYRNDIALRSSLYITKVTEHDYAILYECVTFNSFTPGIQKFLVIERPVNPGRNFEL